MRRLPYVVAALTLGAAGAYIGARVVTPAPACGAGNAGELIVDGTTFKYCNGTSFLTVGGAPASIPDATFFPNPPNTLRIWGRANVLRGASGWGTDGLTSITESGGGADNLQVADANYQIRKLTPSSLAVTGRVTIGSDTVRAGHRNRFVANVWLSNVTTTTHRLYAGMFKTDPPSVVPAFPGPAASAEEYVGVIFDKATSANFLCCSGDGSNQSCVDTTVAASVGEANFDVDWSVAGTLTCAISPANAATVIANKGTNLSTSTTELFPTVTYRMLATDAGAAVWAGSRGIWLEHN